MPKRQRPGRPPLAVQIAVAQRQLIERGIWTEWSPTPAQHRAEMASDQLDQMLGLLFGQGIKTHLDHEPALRTRAYNPRIKNIAARYTPHAHSADHLIWRDGHAHHIKTNVRGDGAQFADRVLIKRQRRRERDPWRPVKKTRRKPRTKHKRKWPSRPFPKGRKVRWQPIGPAVRW